MSTVFTGDEIIDMAVKTEETGYAFYELAKKNAQSEKLKDLFDYLAKAEMEHKALYQQLKGSLGEEAQGVPVDWDEVGLYIQAMVDSSFFLGGEKNINMAAKTADETEAVDFAIGFEKDTLLFFHQIKDMVKGANRPVVERIIEEEKDHIKKLAEIKKSL